MNKRYAFILALLLTGVTLNIYYIFNFKISQAEFSPEKIIISRVIDGDTLQTADGRILRLLNINAPEKGAPGQEEAKKFLAQYINKSIEAVILGKDKYQRYLARLYSPEYINLKMVEKGLAGKFLVRENELSLFNNAEKQAINTQQGLWQSSSFAGCISTKIDQIAEIITLINHCPNMSIKSWRLKDESRAVYTFAVMFIKTISLHSSKGEENATDLYWGKSTEVWNNDRDTLYLFDNEAKLVHAESYGY